MTQPTNRRLVTEAKLSTDLSAKVNSSTYTAGLAAKQDAATLAADTAAHLADGSALDVALKAAYAANHPDTEGPLTNIAKAKTGAFRILQVGTSIASFARSPNQVLCEYLKSRYGDTNSFTVRGGMLGGSWSAAFLGWEKQRYGGPSYRRARGSSSSTALVHDAYGDELVIEWSRETNSGACDITVDGVVVGQSPAAGAQAYGVRQTYALTLGPHRVTLSPPASGYAYFERMEIRTAARTGVEYIDATLGGSALGDMLNPGVAEAPEVTTIPVVGDNGIDAHFLRNDVDLFMLSHLVNDAGLNQVNLAHLNTVYKPTIDKIVAKTAALRRPLVIIVEMGGHFSLPNDAGNSNSYNQFVAMRNYLLSLRQHNHVTVIDQHGATIMSDLAAYAARYYPTVSALNVAAGTYSGDFIHAADGPGPRTGTSLLARAFAVPTPPLPLATDYIAERLHTLPAGAGQDAKATVEGATVRFPIASGMAYHALAWGASEAFHGAYRPYYRRAVTNALATSQTLIDASGTSDTYGKYLVWDQRNTYSDISWTGTPTRMFTVRASGIFVVQVQGAIDVWVNGAALPRGSSGQIRYITPTDEPVVFSCQLHSSVASDYFNLSGKVYEVALTDSTVPLLLA